jgi:hypothetical protein
VVDDAQLVGGCRWDGGREEMEEGGKGGKLLGTKFFFLGEIEMTLGSGGDFD